uniref:Uncharacterized protein n=1 Tax=Gossypium raimondii TaxID=29730 RepID=A0A0D2U2K3_GOSRA|nr:hypothetical protein B456_008G135200 [Gossypium raimondii]
MKWFIYRHKKLLEQTSPVTIKSSTYTRRKIQPERVCLGLMVFLLKIKCMHSMNSNIRRCVPGFFPLVTEHYRSLRNKYS